MGPIAAQCMRGEFKPIEPFKKKIAAMTSVSNISRRSVLGLIPASLLVGVGAAQDSSEKEGPGEMEDSDKAIRICTVVFVRHCETDGPSSTNPGLSKEGAARAAAWVDLLQALPVTDIFATEYRRTQDSMKPIAKQTGLKVNSYGGRDSEGFVEAIRKSPNGRCIVVAGHSNTVPQMVGLLGGKLDGLDKRGFLSEHEHERIIIQTLFAQDKETSLRAIQTLDLRHLLGH